MVIKAFLSCCWMYIWISHAFSKADDRRQSSPCRVFSCSPVGLVYVVGLGRQRSDYVHNMNLEQLRWQVTTPDSLEKHPLWNEL